MIKALIDKVATSLVTLNSTWLSEVRAVGYLHRKPEGDLITYDGIREMGITDKEGNSGHIRFKNDANIDVSESSERYSSCEVIAQRISIDLRLIVVVQDSIPEDLAMGLIIQLNSITFPEEEYKRRNVRLRALKAGSNTLYNVFQETGKLDINDSFNVVFVDFRIIFDWRQGCDNENISITMSNCINDDFTDYGCVQYCEGVELNQNADYTGLMILKTYFNGISVTQSFDVVDGEPIIVPTDNLNADYEYIIELMNEDGESVTIMSNDPTPTEHESFKIKVTP